MISFTRGIATYLRGTEPFIMRYSRQRNVVFLCLRWHVQRGVVCIPKSVTPSRIQQNLQVFDFSLSEGDLKLIESLNRNERFIVPAIVVSHQS